ncbi:MAG TPA: hypothetical protein VGH65_00135 [Verrucomicrobiaceae bacterium]
MAVVIIASQAMKYCFAIRFAALTRFLGLSATRVAGVRRVRDGDVVVAGKH